MKDQGPAKLTKRELCSGRTNLPFRKGQAREGRWPPEECNPHQDMDHEALLHQCLMISRCEACGFRSTPLQDEAITKSSNGLTPPWSGAGSFSQDKGRVSPHKKEVHVESLPPDEEHEDQGQSS